VVLAAVLVGVVVLANTTSKPTVKAASAATTTTRPPAATSTTVPVAHPPGTVNVLVLNGVDPKKAIAKPAATQVSAAGFATLPPRDATKTVTASVVYFQPGFQPDAAAVARLLSIPPAAVVPLPTPPPPEIGDLGGAQVVVIVGPDAPLAAG
jgi:hypothetical protein